LIERYTEKISKRPKVQYTSEKFTKAALTMLRVTAARPVVTMPY